MAKPRYSEHRLTDLRHRFRELAEIALGRDPKEYRQRLRQMAEMGFRVWIAEVDRRIVGSIGFMPDQGRTGWTESEAMREAARAKGVDPETVQVRSLIYVAKESRGRGVASELERRTNKTSRALGFKYRAAFAYDNEEIFRWIHRHGNAISLDMDEPTGTGFPASVVPIDRP